MAARQWWGGETGTFFDVLPVHALIVFVRVYHRLTNVAVRVFATVEETNPPQQPVSEPSESVTITPRIHFPDFEPVVEFEIADAK